MRGKRGVVLLMLGVVVALGLAAGCSKQLPTGVDASGITPEDKLDQNGSVAVFQLKGDPQHVAVRYAMVATKDRTSGAILLMSWQEAERKLQDDDPARMVTVWRRVSADRTYDRSLQNETPSEDSFRAELKRQPGIFSEDPPPIIPCGCRCSCCQSWGCLKVCC